MKELHFTVSQILEDFTKGCGATFIIIVLIMSQKVCKKKTILMPFVVNHVSILTPVHLHHLLCYISYIILFVSSDINGM